MRRGGWVAVGAAVVVVVGAGVAVAVSAGDSGSSSTPTRRSTTLQPVERRNLQTTTDVAGTVGFGDPLTVSLSSGSSSASSSSSSAGAAAGASGSTSSAASSGSSTGTITALPAVGTVIQPGQSLVEIDGVPRAYLMIGTRPMWRTLTSGVSDGPDVEQLEASLVQLGFGGSMTVDQQWTGATTSAVEAWQKSVGLDQTGSLSPTDIVFLPGPVRVASQTASVGSSASGAVLSVTGTTPFVVADLDAGTAATVRTGEQFGIDTPDGKTVTGTVWSIGAPTTSTSTSGQGNQSSQTTTSVPVSIVVTEADLGKFDGASVTVHVVTATAENVLAVPVKSLLALAEGGYALERVRGGRHQLVKVTPSTYAGGFVAVTGDLRQGDRVVTP